MAFQTGLLGKKLGMTQVFTQTGDRSAVTAIQAGPCVVLDLLTKEKHGYSAVKIGFGEKPLRLANKAEIGFAKKANLAPQRVVREFRVEPADLAKFEVGKTIALTDIFKPMSYIDVEGVSKGKGTQGVMKRHNFPGFRATHGTHEFFRHGGSIGCRLTPGKVHKGKRMGGHMGSANVSVQNLVLLEIDAENNILLVRGAIPGGKEGIVAVKNSLKKFGKPVRLKGQAEAQERSKNPLKASKAAAGGGAKKAAPAKK